MNEQQRGRTAFVDIELAAVWRGHERGVVTRDEMARRLEELERLLWRRVLGRLGRVAPGAAVYVGFAAGSRPADVPAGEAAGRS